jgi:hypothetical protein
MTNPSSRNRTVHWRSRKTNVSPSSRILLLLLGLVLLALSSLPFFRFPILGFWVLPLGVIYLLTLLVMPRLWLFVLPLATVSLDLTTWTGRFSYNEFDYLVLLTLASGLLYGRYRFKVYAPSPAMVIALLYLVVVFLEYSGWTYFVLAPQSSHENPYYTGEYAYKVVRGLIWGVALVPMWGYLLAVDKQRATRALVTGLCAAAIVLGIIVMWERGTLGVLLSGSAWYHVVNSLLDLSSSYRVTAVFSDMHTGGEVIDGLILLLLPATLYGSLQGGRVNLRMISVVAFLGLAYVSLVGFTRTTYVAFAVGVALYVALVYWFRRKGGRPLELPVRQLILTLLVGLIAAVFAYRFAGSNGLVSFGALLALSFARSYLRDSLQVRVGLLIGAMLILSFAVSAHFNSRWVDPSWLGAVGIVLGLAIAFYTSLKLFGGTTALPQFDRWFVLVVCVLLPVLAAFALGGYQIEDRFGRVTRDLDVRQAHWAKVVQSIEGGFEKRLLGNGIGRFPGLYISAHPGEVSNVGSFTVAGGNRDKQLHIGGGRDLVFGQRVAVDPHTIYTADIRLRSEREGRLVVSLCERNILYPTEFVRPCVSGTISLESTGGEFVQQTIDIDSGKIGGSGILKRWPTIFTLQYPVLDSVIQIDSINLSTNGFNLLQNGSFSAGLDNWFYYYDYAHLPWHVKNLFLQVWFELGWLGLGFFVTLLGLLVKTTFGKHAADTLVPVYVVGVMTVCLFGLFGSPLDSARVSWLFYFYMFAGLARLRLNKKSSWRPRPN